MRVTMKTRVLRTNKESATNSTGGAKADTRESFSNIGKAVSVASPEATLPCSGTAPQKALSVISPTEQKKYAECEAIIEKGWETFVEVGRALARIRDKKLYRSEHDTFEAYCREKWQYAKSHVYRLIGAAEVLTCLSPIGEIG